VGILVVMEERKVKRDGGELHQVNGAYEVTINAVAYLDRDL
jgi:hypothetical protein